jgi:type I restriction enzyme R subunit
LFNLESGVPTDNYTLDEAVRDGFLVPPKAVSVPLRFQREGISYNQLSDDEKEEWDALEWSDDGTIPNRVEAEAVNRWLFNKDTVDKVLEHLMTRGLKVAGGDRLGKTIIFAKNHDHAQFIAERFNLNYPHYKGEFARVIDFETEYVQSLIDNFSIVTKDPHIAISVDMLDTGIDIPEVVNLVFFKLVRSKTKFWQMIGRGTRLCPDLFAPGKDKEFFYVFDYCQNLEFFSQQLPTTEGAASASLAKRLFTARVELIGELDKKVSIEQGQDGGGLSGEAAGAFGAGASDTEVRRATAELLRTEVAAMNVNNFVVRPKRRFVEKYASTTAWTQLDGAAYTELTHEIAGLPTELDAEDEEAKRFDLLILNLQLAILRHEPSFERLRVQVKNIAGLLQDQASIPMIQAELPLILDLQTDEWWQDVTVPILENARRRLRSLVKLIEKKRQQPIYTDFEGLMGGETEFTLPGFSTPSDFERFRAKARQFLKANENHLTVYKLRLNEPLTAIDLAELERMLSESGIGTAEDLEKAKADCDGLGLFVRSLVGLDREAAKKALGGFIAGKTLRANQIEFPNLIIDHLTEHGAMEARLLYDSPYTDFSARGVDGVFESGDVDELVSILEDVRKKALG